MMEHGRTTMKKVTTTTKKRTGGSKEGTGGNTPSQLIDARIKELSDWRGKTLARIRSLIKQADSALGGGGSPSMKKSGLQNSKSPSQLIDARIKELGDWRGKMLSRLRALVKEADPEVVEEWKWRGVPVWSHDGLICTGETYKNVVKMTFAKGAALKDPSSLFNSSLEGNTRRAIDFHEGEKIDEKALKTLVRAAVTLNKSKAQN